MEKRVSTSLLAAVLLLACVLPFAPVRADSTQTIPKVVLTEAEKAWIKTHPKIVFGTDKSWRPQVIQNPDGSIGGIDGEIIDRINALTGLNLQITLGTWKEIQERAKRKELDGLVAATHQKAREPYFLFSDSPYSMHKYIFTRHSNVGFFRDMRSLAGKRLAYIRGNQFDEKMLARYPDILGVPQSSHPASMEALIRGDVDAVMGGLNFQYLLRERAMTEVEVALVVPDSELKLLYCIRKDWPQLKTIINKALATISFQERLAIVERHAGDVLRARPPKEVDLTPGEKDFLKAHRVIRLASDNNWAPVESIDGKGRFQGISADFIELIGERLGIEFRTSPKKPWFELMEMVRNRDLDLMTAAMETEDRKAFARFTAPYISHPIVIMTNDTVDYVDGLRGLAGKKVALAKGYAVSELVMRKDPELEVEMFDDPLSAMLAVSKGQVFAYLGNIASSSHLIRRHGIANLKVSGETPHRYELGFGVRSDWPELVAVLQKALDTITEEEKSAIFKKWVAVNIEAQIDYMIVWQIVAASALLMAAVLYWNLTLQRARRAALDAGREAKEAREAADSANRAKSNFLANMSHELRTPLNAILGFSRLLRNTETLSAQEQRKVGIINRSGEHLLQLINDVLDLSKIEAGHIELTPMAFGLNALVQDVSGMVRVRAEEKGLQLIVVPGEGLPHAVIGDEAKLRQILINLLSNAVKYTETGQVTLSLEAEEAGNGELLLSGMVEDTGIGVGPEEIGRIFQPFEQLLHSGEQKGTGLGLAITRQFVEMMGGRISVESIPGEGSRFRFMVRVATASDELVPERTDSARRVVGLALDQPEWRVLIVEDQEENRLLLKEVLEQIGFAAHTAENGAEAVEAFLAWKPHFIWMDMRMPVMDGYEATARIRALPDGDTVKIVALTASAFREQRDSIMDSGCDDLVFKPFHEGEIFDTMERHLGVQFIYEEEEEPLPPPQPLRPEDIAKLPLDLVEQMHETTRKYRQAAMYELIDQIPEDQADLATGLRLLVDEFDWDRLEILFGKHSD